MFDLIRLTDAAAAAAAVDGSLLSEALADIVAMQWSGSWDAAL
jgi:hypothetical protein